MTMGIHFETVIPFSVFDEEENQYLVNIPVKGTYFPPTEKKNPHIVDSDWDCWGLQSYFDYEVLAVESSEDKELNPAWWDDAEFEMDLYGEIKDFLYEKYEKHFDGFIVEDEDGDENE